MTLNKIAKLIESFDGRLFIVGGWIRDRMMGIEPTDLDLMVQGLDEETTIKIFSHFGQFERVIGNAPVFLFTTAHLAVEVALARREVSVSQGKKGFQFVADKNVTLKEDLSRRDFTCNALAEDFLTGEIFDFFGGQSDIEDGILRPVSDAFVESPERVLRGMAQAARFDFMPTNEFFDMAIEMKKDFHTIKIEQIWRHFEKMLSKGTVISMGLMTLNWTWIEFFPELNDVKDWNQMCETVDQMVEICDREDIFGQDRIVLILAAMSFQMEEKTFDFLESIGCPQSLQSKIFMLGTQRLVWWQDVIDSKLVKNLSVVLQPATIRELGFLVESIFGQLPEKMNMILDIALGLDIENKPLAAILQGRHLIARDMTPSPEFGRILKMAFNAQLDESFDDLDGALNWLGDNLCECGSVGHLAICPYDEDIHGEITECSCCDSCRQMCCDDI